MLHLIVNPTAGRGRALPHLDGIVRTLEAAGATVAVRTTENPEAARAIVAALPEQATAVAVGGDGTVHAVMRACFAHDRRLGVLPFGSGDDFAHALGLGRTSPDAAVRALLEGRERRIDVGTVNEEPFVNAFGTGFDAEVARRILAAPQSFRGVARYLYGVFSALRDFHLTDVALEMTTLGGDLERFEGPALLVAVQNGPRTGGSFRFAPGARPDDGVLDVVVAGAFGRGGTLAILPRVMRGTHLDHPKVHRFAVTSVDLRWSTPVAGHAEGEPVGVGGEYRVRLNPGALRVVAPCPARRPTPKRAPRPKTGRALP